MIPMNLYMQKFEVKSLESYQGNKSQTWKPIHMDHYLQLSSHHPLIHKLDVIRTLYHRADTAIRNTDNIRKEKENIQIVLHKCGCPRWAFQKAGKKTVTNTDSQKEWKQSTWATIP